ncbi:MAG TPA: 30S ribosomal protein S2 [Gemmatimonadota bacterium]|nr:30S ribosomal protein S2 [Gemmatimonadota bacterium]
MAVSEQLRTLLEAGVHFGHQTRRWNPKMRRFIFAERNGIYLIDLNKTLRQLEHAREVVRDIVGQGKRVLFVCTKRQLTHIVREEAERCGQFYVTNRWLGGTLTNFRTIKKNLKRLKEIERMRTDGTFELLPKKEVIEIEREFDKLYRNLSGIADMEELPGAVFVVDARKERIAVNEANKLGIPLIAIVDTNADPDLITVPIAGNDDAIKSVRLIAGQIADAVLEAQARLVKDEAESEEGEKTAVSAAPDMPRRPRRRVRARLPVEADEAAEAEAEPEEGEEAE